MSKTILYSSFLQFDQFIDLPNVRFVLICFYKSVFVNRI